MSQSKDLYQLQEIDSSQDAAEARIKEIDLLLADMSELRTAQSFLEDKEEVFSEKLTEFKKTETAVEDHNVKIDQNQKRLYGGAITNPKELEDLQLESQSLQKYLSLLEERQLVAMLEMEEAEKERNEALATHDSLEDDLKTQHALLENEKISLQAKIKKTKTERERFLSENSFDDLSTYLSIRKASGGIAVTLMISDSCSACGANIPSAIAQEARSPGILAFCPTCKRILHPG